LPFASRTLAARRLWRILGVADGTQRGSVKNGAVVEVQDEDRGVGRSGIEFVDGRQPLLGELVFGEATDDTHPLRRRRDRDLLPQHGHRVGERPYTVPAQFHVGVEPAADDVKVIVDQPRQDTATPEVDDLCGQAGELHHLLVVTDGGEDTVLYRHRAGCRIAAIERGEQASVQDEIRRTHERFSFATSGISARASV
jgi:hypothetical protein